MEHCSGTRAQATFGACARHRFRSATPAAADFRTLCTNCDNTT